MHTPLRRLLILLALATSAPLQADLVVVTPARSEVDSLSREDVINIFMGRFRQFPRGGTAHPIDLPGHHPDRARFYQLLINKSPAEVNAYWARLTFSGKTRPPPEARSVAEATDWLARQEGAIGYLDRSRVDARHRIVLELGR
ncbi:MAG: hypothetical protein ACOZB0_10080 [Pseudomonadota bacterium]